ncbi:hypothetical protein Psta_2191 [Pirellula staleyi DSM 6068]|uniref:Uncharacterized protein n=1 Tax=Pirellula staleyi (strain ATCC 27377 / DSM 6068 / ICPB 4128) TaxID=530564 RepID=D2R2M3_PIRSD|nr:hypothetical protein [Pirellula staleyi]ADB16863.1 hypothetical protein Psta_2191 [Pirellula staleyi DSM 6068]
MAKKAAAGPSKSEVIRKYKADHPELGPTAIAEALTKEGHKVSPAFVSTILSNAKKGAKAGAAPKAKRGRKPGSGKKAAAGPAAGDSSLDTLIAAKKLADQMGGIAKAKAALDTLAKLLG